MLAIRLARVGKKNKAQFKVVLQEHTVAPGGRHVEILGSYDPHSKVSIFKEERIKYWISKGAQTSDTVYNLLISKGVILGKKKEVRIPAKKVEEKQNDVENKKDTQMGTQTEAKEEAVVSEAPKEEIKPKEKSVEELKVEEKKEVKIEEKKTE